MAPDFMMRSQFLNQGFFFYGLLCILMDVRQSKANSPVPFPDWIRKRLERLDTDSTTEQIVDLCKLVAGPIAANDMNQIIREVEERVPEDGAHAGAWTFIESFAKGIYAAAPDTERQHYAEFLLALAAIDRTLLVTQSLEDAEFWSNRLFPWMTEIEPDQLHICNLLLWASLERLFWCIANKRSSVFLEGSSDLLSKALPAVKKDGKLVLSSGTLFQYLRSELPQLIKGTKPTFTDLAGAISINDKTLQRVRSGELKVRREYLVDLIRDKHPISFEATLINMWTQRQSELHKAGMAAGEIVEYFSHYDESVKRVFRLFEGFKATGKVCLSH